MTIGEYSSKNYGKDLKTNKSFRKANQDNQKRENFKRNPGLDPYFNAKQPRRKQLRHKAKLRAFPDGPEPLRSTDSSPVIIK